MHLDQKKSVVLVLLDLSAAFDTVDHGILLDRLCTRVGLTGTVLAWIRSYLSDRTQQVAVCQTVSEESSVAFGVPQGSVLGPILFSLYLLPLGDLLRSLSVSYHLYADDTQLYLAVDHSDSTTSFTKMEQAISKISGWMSTNFLRLNHTKTEVLVISSRYCKQRPHQSLAVGNDSLVAPSATVKDLGAYLSSDMSTDKQISTTCRTIWLNLRNIKKIRHFLTYEAAHAAVRALALPRLDFHNGLLYGAPDYQIKRLQRVQNAAARLVVGADYGCHVTPILKSLHWLPVHSRIQYKLCLLTYQALNGKGPWYLQELLQSHRPTRALRSSSNKCTLAVPRTRTVTYGDRAFTTAAPKLWNSLPESLKCSSSEAVFRRDLKTYLFSRSYGNA